MAQLDLTEFGGAAPTLDLSEFEQPTPKPRGMVRAFGAGLGQASSSALRGAAHIVGATPVEEWAKKQEEGFAPTKEETESIPLSIARAVGGVLPVLASATPVGRGLKALGVGAGMVKNVASAVPFIGLEQAGSYANLKEQGVDTKTAATSAAVGTVLGSAMMGLPVSVVGKVIPRVASGALIAEATGEVSRQTQNKILEDHPDMLQPFTTVGAITNLAVGGLLGGVFGRNKQVKDAIKDSQKRMDDGTLLETPPPAEGGLELAPVEPLTPPAPPTGGLPFERFAMSKLAVAEPQAPELMLAPTGTRIVPPTGRGIGFETGAGEGIQLAPDGSIPRVETQLPFELRPSPARELTLEAAPEAPTTPEMNLAQRELSLEAPLTVPDRHDMVRIAREVLGGEGVIPAQHLTSAVKGAESVAEVATRLRARADALKDTRQNAERKQALNELADHFSPKERPSEAEAPKETPQAVAPEAPKPEELTAEQRAAEYVAALDAGGISPNTAKTNTIARDLGLEVSKKDKPEITNQRIREAVARAKETQNAVQVESPTEIPIRQEAGAGERVRVENAQPEVPPAARPEEGGNAPGAETLTWAQRIKPLSEAIPQKVAPVDLVANRRAEARAVLEQENLHDLFDQLPVEAQNRVAQHLQEASDYADARRPTESMAAANKAKLELFMGQAEADETAHLSGTARKSTKPVTPTHTVAQAEAEVRSTAKKWTNAPRVHMKLLSELSAADQQWLRDNNTKAFFDSRTGEVTIVSDLHADLADIKASLFHEVLGHKGLQGKFKAGLDDVLTKIYDTNKDLRAEVDAYRTKYPKDSVAKATEEVLSIRQEAGILPQNAIMRMVAYVRAFMRKHGMVSDYSNNDILQLLRETRESVTIGKYERWSSEAARTRAKSLFGRAISVNESEKPSQAFGAMGSAIKAAQSAMDKASPDALNRASQFGRKEWLKWSNLTHIAQMVETLKWLPKQYAHLPRMFSDLEARADARNSAMNLSGSRIIHMHQQLKELPGTLEALNTLKGKYQQAGIFPHKTLEEHATLRGFKDVSELPGEFRRDYKEAQELFNKKGVGEAYTAEAKHNQWLRDAQVATMRRSLAQTYGVPEHIWKNVDVVADKPLESDAMVKMMEHIEKDPSVSPDTREQFKSMNEFYNAGNKPAYFHVARFGDFMAHFKIADTPDAVKAVQDAMNFAGVKDKIVVDATDQGKRIFSMFETQGEMQAVEAQLQKLVKAGHLEPLKESDGADPGKGFTVGATVDKLQALDSSAPAFARNMMEKISADVHLSPEERASAMEMVRRNYISMLPEGNSSKLLARRAWIGGYSADMSRAFAEQAGMQAWFIAQHSIRPDVSIVRSQFREALNRMENSASPDYAPDRVVQAADVLNEINLRVADRILPVHTPVLDMAASLGHSYALGMSPSYIINNLLQPAHLLMPLIGARHGWVRSAKELAKASNDAAKILYDVAQQGYKNGKWTGIANAEIVLSRAEHLSQADRDVLQHAIAEGRLDMTRISDLTRLREGSSPRIDAVLKIVNMAAHYGELMNRIATTLTSSRLETARLVKDGILTPKQIEAKVNRYVIETIDGSQINYSVGDRARAIGKHGVFKAYTPLIMQFQQYNMGVLQTLIKLTTQSFKSESSEVRAEARRALAGLLATTGALAGTLGLPMAGVITGAYNALAGSEDAPVDAKSDFQNMLSDQVGPEGGQVLAHGLANYVTGVDVAGKTGLDNIVPFTQLFSTLADDRRKFKDRIDSGAFQFLGPMVGMTANVVEGLKMIADGDTLKGLEKASPPAIRGAVKSYQLGEKGFTDSRGMQFTGKEPTWSEMALQAAGYTPTVQSKQGEAQRGISAMQSALKMRASELATRFAKAVEEQDMAARKEVIAEAAEFRRQNPSVPVNFGGAVKRRAQEKALARVSGAGVRTRASQLPFVQEQTRFAAEEQP